MLIRYFNPGTSQFLDTSGCPFGFLGAGAERLGLPSGVRGTAGSGVVQPLGGGG
jgi:hypothetical protein